MIETQRENLIRPLHCVVSYRVYPKFANAIFESLEEAVPTNPEYSPL